MLLGLICCYAKGRFTVRYDLLARFDKKTTERMKIGMIFRNLLQQILQIGPIFILALYR